MQSLCKAKSNNDGSTIVFVVVALMFIGLLATLVLALSAAGYKMRTVDYKARQTFYEGEEYSGKIYSELGMNAVGVLGESYVAAMGKLNSGDITSQDALNDYLKQVYYKNMLVYLHLISKDTKDEDVLPFYSYSASDAAVSGVETASTPDSIEVMLQKIVDPTKTNVIVYINDQTSVADDSVVKVTCALEGGVTEDGDTFPLITIHDVHLQYLNTTDKYESNYTFDIVLCYPEWDFTFSNPVSASSDIDTFLDYVLISNDMIKFDNVNESIVGSISTGSNRSVASNNEDTGLVIDRSDVQFSASAEGNYRYEPLAVVVTDNIRVDGTAGNPGYMYIQNGRVWCNSIIVDREASLLASADTGSKFLSQGSKLYIQDDLQLDGDFSSAEVSGGTYFGYSMNTRTDNKVAQNSSSAIIVNGNNSNITLKSISKLYVNGLAYLNFGDNNYRTGESLAPKGSQDAYLVPSAYMGGTQANPVRSGITIDTVALKEALVGSSSTFFASEESREWLDEETPFVTRDYMINGKEYVFYYLNFKTYSDQREYIEYVLTAEAGDDAVLKDIQDRINKSLADMHETETSILEVQDTTNGYTTGAMVTAEGGILLGSASASTIAGVTLDTLSMRNRYLLMKSLLMPVVGSTALDNEPQVLSFANVHCMDLWYKLNHISEFPEYEGMTEYRSIINQQLNNSAVENIINFSKLRQYTVNEPGGIWQRTHDGATITYVTPTADNVSSSDGRIKVQDGIVKISGSYTGVVVVDGDVEIKGDVEGLVVASGGVTVTSSGTLKSNSELVDTLMKKEQSADNDTCHIDIEASDRRSDVFKFYPVVGSKIKYGESINQLKYSDVIYYDNWRKYEDSRVYGEVISGS